MTLVTFTAVYRRIFTTLQLYYSTTTVLYKTTFHVIIRALDLEQAARQHLLAAPAEIYLCEYLRLIVSLLLDLKSAEVKPSSVRLGGHSLRGLVNRVKL